MANAMTDGGAPFVWSAMAAGRLDEVLREYRAAIPKASAHPTFRSYVDILVGGLPEAAAGARSIVMAAVRSRPGLATLELDGRTVRVPIAQGYWDDGITSAALAPSVRRAAGVPDNAFFVAVNQCIPDKLLAARAGVIRYGRNNIGYAEGLGSFIALRAWATDAELPEGRWGSAEALPECEACGACLAACPTGAIRAGGFLIDATRCISLYNEVEGTFPGFVASARHTALMGCLACQACCPANAGRGDPVPFEALDAADSAAFLAGSAVDDDTGRRISARLRLGDPGAWAESAAVFARNLRAWLATNGIAVGGTR